MAKIGANAETICEIHSVESYDPSQSQDLLRSVSEYMTERYCRAIRIPNKHSY